MSKFSSEAEGNLVVQEFLRFCYFEDKSKQFPNSCHEWKNLADWGNNDFQNGCSQHRRCSTRQHGEDEPHPTPSPLRAAVNSHDMMDLPQNPAVGNQQQDTL